VDETDGKSGKDDARKEVLKKPEKTGAPPQTPEFSASGQDWLGQRQKQGWAGSLLPAPIPAAGPALGSLSSVDLSSVRVLEVYRKTVASAPDGAD
jgi:hypothetical protein